MKVVVAGGGYAGLACLLELRSLAPRAELHLLDPCAAHVKQTRLHETMRRPLADLRVPFDGLARSLGFEYHEGALGRDGAFGTEELRRWSADACVRLGRERIDFDWLVIATGARPRLRAAGTEATRRVFDQIDIRERDAREIVEACFPAREGVERRATVVGGGASGVQIAFELAERLRKTGARVRLVDAGPRLLAALPPAAHDYVVGRMSDAGIDYVPSMSFLRQDGERLHVAATDGAELVLESQLTLLFAGVDAHPELLHANRFGQVMAGKDPLPRVFTAGDCSQYASRGLNAATAQAAVRKGKHVAANIARLQRGRQPIAWTFQELGYVVSLGSLDGVGWLLVRENVVKGAAASAIATVVEAQYDLFVEGIDTYLL